MSDAAGNSPHPLLEKYALRAVQDLNIEYNQYNIFFKYYGMGHFNWTGTYPIPAGEFSDLVDHAQDNGHFRADSFNVYTYPTAGGIAWLNNTVVGVHERFYENPNVLNHEIGHSFNLSHTHTGYNGNNCEHVTRNPNDPAYNATTAGDRVIDTAAMPDFRNEYCWLNGIPNSQCPAEYRYYYLDAEECEYIGNSTDCEDTQYQIFPSDVRNYMAYTRVDCNRIFTQGQAIRMHEAIANDYMGRYSAVETSFATLYEPYRGSYPMYYPHPQPWELPMFQPGFTYDFVECCCDYQQPAEYNDPNFGIEPGHIIKHIGKYENDYSIIYHPNHSAIIIHEIDEAFSAAQVQMCYDNYNTPPVKGGKVFKFNDNIFNTNVTITEKNPAEITDPQLVPNLENGLYKIETNYDNGANEETVIFKTGN